VLVGRTAWSYFLMVDDLAGMRAVLVFGRL
jgi:hypothetical protein